VANRPSLIREWAELRRLFSSAPESRRLVFYAERAFDYRTFEGLIPPLLRSSEFPIAYVTSDPADPLLAQAGDRIRPFFLDRLLPLAVLFLDARVLVMTMPDLHQFHLRRSVRGAHHLYVFHAMVSTHMIYRFGAFDHYDTLFCVGPHHLKEIRKTESLYGLPAKRLFEVGYPRLDHILEEHRNFRPAHPPGGKGTVLVAPSWGDANILESCIGPIARSLSGAGYAVVIRPHPEAVKRHPDLIRRISEELCRLPGVSLERDHLSDRSLHEADLLISDWSGIALEYAFGTERPVLFLDVPRKVNNPRYAELGLEPLESGIREKIGRILPLSRLENVVEEAGEMLKNQADYRDRILRERSLWVYHPGESASVGARILLDLCSAP